MDEPDYKVLLSISEAVSTLRDRDELFELIAERAQPLFGFNQHWNIFVYNDEQNSLQQFLAGSNKEVEFVNALLSQMQPFPVEGIFKTILETNEILATDDGWKTCPKTSSIDGAAAQLCRNLNFKHAFAVALHSFDRVIGTFHVCFDEPQSFTETQLRLFKAITNFITAAVANILANEKILQREREKSVLLRIAEDIANVHSKRDLLQIIVKRLKPLFNFYDCGILLLDQDKRFYYDLMVQDTEIDRSAGNYFLRDSGFYQTTGIQFENSYLRQVFERIEETGKPLLFDYEPEHPGYSDSELLATHKNFGFKEGLIGRLKNGGEAFGAFIVNALEKNHFRPEQFDLFQSVADLIAVAVANILANEEILEREREKSQLLEITELIAQIKATDELLKLLIEKIKPLFNFYDCGLFVISSDGQTHSDLAAVLPGISPSVWNEKIAAVSRDVPHPDSAIEQMMRTIEAAGKPVLLDFAELVEQFPTYPQLVAADILELGYRDCLATNLVIRGTTFGMFCINARSKNFFQPSMFGLFQTVTHSISIALANILANEEILRLSEERFQRAEELAKSNEALARTSARLANRTDLPAFLNQIVVEATIQLNANAGHLMVFNEESNSLETVALVEAGEVVPFKPFASHRPVNEIGFFSIVRETRKPEYFDVEKETHLLWKGSLEFHRQRRHKVIFVAPLYAGDKILGVLGLALLDQTPFDEQKTEFIVALAQQAALAIQLTQLADKARREAEAAATLEERNRIAREIHDTLAQGFTGVIVQLEAARKVFGESTPEKVSEHVTRSIDLAREGLTEARRSVLALRPPSYDELELDLPALLREKLTALTVDTGIKTEFVTTGTPHRIPLEMTINLLRIGQEAITNALRHSRARDIKIALEYKSRAVCLLISDDGCGFNVGKIENKNGYGLRGMRERAAIIKARLEISSEPGQGTKIKASLGDCD